jgi:hypothetical protein
MSGTGGRLRIGKGSKGFWKYSAGVTWASPGLELNDLGYMRMADDIQQENQISYLINKPVSIFNSYTITLEQFNSWNFRGTYLGSGSHLNFTSQFKNNWNFASNLIFHSSGSDTRKLRGGPSLIMPYRLMTSAGISTDASKNLVGTFGGRFEKGGDNSFSTYSIQSEISYRPLKALKLSVAANYSENADDLQYVSTLTNTSGNKYILGTIDQKTLGLTFRVDVNITPELSIQYYGSPFVSKGEYSEFRRIAEPSADQYSARFIDYTAVNKTGGLVFLDPVNIIPDPDFNFYQFRSNLVAKWEYRLGSFIYFVWSVDRTGSINSAKDSLGKSFGMLEDAFPNNIFLIKLNYWFSL